MRVNDAVFGIIVALIGAAIIWIATGFPEMPGQSYGPALMPTIIGAGFVLSGGLLIVGGLSPAAAPRQDVRPEVGTDQLLDATLVVVAIVAFILLTNVLGFLLTGWLTTAGLMIRFRRGKWISSLIISAVLTVAIDYAFRKFLLVPLPLGPLQTLVW